MDLGSLLGGLTGDQGQGKGEGDPMADMLGSLLGGMQQGGANQGDDVLGSLSGGAPQGGGDVSGLLGALMGGGGGQGGQGADAMMGMLGGLLGGMGGANAGAMGGMNTGMNAGLAPLADMLSEKLGLPREMAMAALTIVVPMILSKLAGGGASSGATCEPGARPITSSVGIMNTRSPENPTTSASTQVPPLTMTRQPEPSGNLIPDASMTRPLMRVRRPPAWKGMTSTS